MQPAQPRIELLTVEDYRALPEGGPRYQTFTSALLPDLVVSVAAVFRR